jgi:hypothetical protein
MLESAPWEIVRPNRPLHSSVRRSRPSCRRRGRYPSCGRLFVQSRRFSDTTSCFRQVREDVAAYLLSHGAQLNPWTAIALDRVDDVRAMIARQPSLLEARMTRNQHRRTPLHHAAAKNRARIVQFLLELGADPNATDATGATALTTASQENADVVIINDLLAAGASLDFLTAVNLGRYGEAEVMLRDDPSRIGPTDAIRSRCTSPSTSGTCHPFAG